MDPPSDLIPDHCSHTCDLWRKWSNKCRTDSSHGLCVNDEPVPQTQLAVVLVGPPRSTDQLRLNRLTVRCFYPLGGVNRLSVDRTFRAEAPGFGLVDIFKNLKG